MSSNKAILESISTPLIASHIRNLEGVRHPGVAPQALERAAIYIEETLLHSYGYEITPHYFSEDGQHYRNLIATHTGVEQPEKKIIVLAHYDTVAVSPGANDNASGGAAVLEMARVLAGCKSRKSILFVAVNLEERKVDDDKTSPFIRGSTALAATARDEGWEIEGVLDFEEIAYAGEMIEQSKPADFPLELPKMGNFIGVIGNQNSAGMVKGFIGAIEQYRISLPYVPMVVPENGEMLPDSRRSDHAAFWDYGYPAIMITDTANFRTPHYHQPTDVFETLNIPFATEVCRAATGLVMNMAGIEGSVS